MYEYDVVKMYVAILFFFAPPDVSIITLKFNSFVREVSLDPISQAMSMQKIQVRN